MTTCLKIRNEIYAHSDATNHPMKIYPAGYFSEQFGREIPRTSLYLGSMTLPPDAVIGFQAVCKDLHERLEKAVFEEIEDLYGEMDLPASPFPLRTGNEGL